MDEINLLSISPLILTLIGIIIDLISIKRSDKLIRSIEICESTTVDVINDQLKKITDHYKREIDRILASVFISSETVSLDVMNIKENSLNLQTSDLRTLVRSIKDIKKLEMTLFRIKIYRFIFATILCITLINFIFSTILSTEVSNILVPFLSISSFVFLMSLIFDLVYTNNLIDKVRKEYGISI